MNPGREGYMIDDNTSKGTAFPIPFFHISLLEALRGKVCKEGLLRMASGGVRE